MKFTLLILAIVIYLIFNIIKEKQKENFTQQDFSIPKVKIHQIKKQQKIHKKKHEKLKFNIEDTKESGKGVHDRIRYDGKWN